MRLVVLLIVLSVAAVPATATVLYDGTRGSGPSRQGWLYVTNPLFFSSARRSSTAQGRVLDTTAARGDQAGWFGFGLVPLDRSQGYSLRFDLRLDAEGHSSGSRAGLGIIALAGDSRGLEIGFWEGAVWVQGDDPLFHRAETAAVDTTDALAAYHLNVVDDRYSLIRDGTTLLAGPLRDYSSFGAPYNLTHFLFIGDDTSSADARFELGRVEANPLFRITTGALPEAGLQAGYDLTLSAAGGSGPLDWRIIDDGLPDGLALAPSSGRIIGLPSEAGQFPLAVAVIDATGNRAEAALTLSVGETPTAAFIHHPYLQRPRPHGIDILWWSDGPTPALLRFGEAGLDQAVVSMPEAIDLTDPQRGGGLRRWRHRVVLDGLKPGQGYGYRVEQGAETFDADFRTSPAATLTPIRFLVWADTEAEPASVDQLGSGAPPGYPMDQDQGLRAGVRAAVALDADFILHAGDLVQEGGRQADWDELLTRLNDPADGPLSAKVPLIAVPGNHDYYGEGFAQPGSETHAMHRFLTHLSSPSNAAPTRRVDPDWPSEQDPDLRAAQDGRYFAFRYGPATFIGLDVNDQGPDEGPADTNWYLEGEADAAGGPAPGWMPGTRQYRWLEETLQQARRQTPFIFVFWHHAPWSQGPHNRVPPADYQIGTPTRALDPLLHRYGVTAVFNGHEEQVEHSETVGDPTLGGDPDHVIRYLIPGTVGDGIRSRVAGIDNPRQVFHYADSRIGRHYGFLVVDIIPGDGAEWTTLIRQAWINPDAADDPLVNPIGGYYDEGDPIAAFTARVEAPDLDADGEPDRLALYRALRPGVSLIAQTGPVDPALASCRALAEHLSVTPTGTAIRRIAGDGRVEGCTPRAGDDFALVPGMGLLIDTDGPTGLTQTWQSECPPLSVHTGSNLIGHPAPPLDLTCHDWLAAQPVEQITVIARLDPGSGRWQTCGRASDADDPTAVSGPDFPIEHGVGYRIQARAAGNLATPGCD